jgi:hypothetical protein
VTGNFMDVFHDHGRPPCRGLAAHTSTFRDAHAGRVALERTKHQFPLSPKIKSRPVDVLKVRRQQRGHIGKVRQPISLAAQQCLDVSK